MTAAPDSNSIERDILGRVGQPIAIVILFDLLSMGLYSVVRSYFVYSALAQKAGHRLFSKAFLHILLLLSLALCVLRYSRESTPIDSTLIFTHLGAACLFISLLLVFRRYLQQEFGLRVLTLPLAVFGFWYLQYRLNRCEQADLNQPIPRDRRWQLFTAILLYVGLCLMGLSVKHTEVPTAAMEPTLVVGDHVLIDQVSYAFFSRPRRADVLLYTSPFDKKTRSIQRVLGVPGDRIAIRGDRIEINSQPLACEARAVEPLDPDAFDRSPKRAFVCQLNGKKFAFHHYQQGALTAIDGVFEVPAEHYFMIGDNLDNSADSRTIGAIPAKFVTGQVISNLASYRTGESVPWHRWFKSIQ